MTYQKLKRRIKQESKTQKEDGITSYISYMGNGVEYLTSNFMDVTGITDNQLIKAVDEGLLKRDWDVLEVI